MIQALLLTTSFPLYPESSSGIFVKRLADSLPENVNVCVITPCGPFPVSDKFNTRQRICCFRYAPWKWQKLAHQPGGIPVALKQSWYMRLLLPLFITAMLLSCMRQARNSDLIHANWSINGAIAGLAGFMANRPVITTLRGEDVTRAGSSWLYRNLLRLCLRGSCRIISVSQAIHERLGREFPHYRHKLVFLPNGVSGEFLHTSPATAKKPSDEFRLLSIGSLIPRKSMDTLITSLTHLPTNDKVRLEIIGDGPERSRLEELIEKNDLSEKVELPGSLPPEAIAKRLQEADVFLLGSHSEGRPNVILESLAAGVPVIATDIDGIRELVEEEQTGLLFSPGDARQLAQCILKLKKNRELQTTLSENGRKFISNNQLYWKDVGERYAKLYQDVLEEQNSACAD